MTSKIQYLLNNQQTIILQTG